MSLIVSLIPTASEQCSHRPGAPTRYKTRLVGAFLPLLASPAVLFFAFYEEDFERLNFYPQQAH
jgi:hypothetical protein